jgi:hypothetical protein
MDYSDCAGNSAGPERAPKRAKRSVNKCVLVSGSPVFLLAIAKDIPNDQRFTHTFLFLDAVHRILSAKI